MQHKIVNKKVPIYERVIVGEQDREEEIWIASDGREFYEEYSCLQYEKVLKEDNIRKKLLENVATITACSLDDYCYRWYLFNTEEDFRKYLCFLTKREISGDLKYFFDPIEDVIFPQWIKIYEDNSDNSCWHFETWNNIDSEYKHLRKQLNSAVPNSIV